MKKGKRYDVSDLVEAQYEPDSDNKVLRNLLGIKDTAEMDLAEANALTRATHTLIGEYDQEHQFSAADICHFHKTWLGDIYQWAGHYRKVNISKDDFSFAMAAQVQNLMVVFERDQLSKYTPCNFEKIDDIVKALAETHTELVLIHPFREGNGRTARLLSTLMALQANLALLDFTMIEKKRQDYFLAVQAGMDRNYAPMEKLFAEIISISAARG
ncbi:MAG: Fic family protein [Pseudomonadota bacterium]